MSFFFFFKVVFFGSGCSWGLRFLPFPLCHSQSHSWDGTLLKSQTKPRLLHFPGCLWELQPAQPVLSMWVGRNGAREEPWPSAARNSHSPTSRTGKFHLGQKDRGGQGGEKSGISNEAWSRLAGRNISAQGTGEFSFTAAKNMKLNTQKGISKTH